MRVLVASTGGDGHLLPMLPLAGALAARDDEVTVAAPVTQRERVQAAGLGFAAVGPTVDEVAELFVRSRDVIAQLPIAERRPFAFSARFAEIEAPRRIDGLRDVVEAWRPDLVIHESADLAAPIASAAAGARCVHHAFGCAIPEPALRRAADAVAPLWRAFGLDPDPLAGAYRGAYIDICPPCLRTPLPETATHIHYLRPAEAAERRGERRARPLVYATLGTNFNAPELFRLLLAVLERVDCDAVMTIGRDRSPHELEPIPSNVTVAQYIPQAEILCDCDLVVSHAGSGSFLAALAHGRPLVLLPQGADQFDNAAACAALGVAEVVLPPELETEVVRQAVEHVLRDPGYALAARAVAAEIDAMPSPAAVADELAEHARETPHR